MQAQASAGENLSKDDMQSLQNLKGAFNTVRKELAKIIVGQDQVVEQLLIAIFSQGTSCWKACRVWRRRSWSARCRGRCIWALTAFSSLPI
jgi:hypothetical protein